MPIVGGLDIHRKQLTSGYLDTATGQARRGQVSPADREHLRAWLARFAGREHVAAHLAEPAQEDYQQALARHRQDERRRRSQLRAARAAHDQMVSELQAQVRDHNAAVDDLERRFTAGAPDAVEEYFTQVLAISQYPAGFPCQYQVAYRPEPRELVIGYRLPPREVIPAERGYRYVKARRAIDALPRPDVGSREDVRWQVLTWASPGPSQRFVQRSFSSFCPFLVLGICCLLQRGGAGRGPPRVRCRERGA